MGKHRGMWVLPGVLAIGIAVAAGTVVVRDGRSGQPRHRGYRPRQINIGAISTLSGPLAGLFGGLAPGMIAYFNTLNAKGGINGRKIVLTNNLDDGGSPSQFTQDVHTLIDQDHVFAVGASSAWFTPGYFVSTKTPTYGYNVSANWAGRPQPVRSGRLHPDLRCRLSPDVVFHQEGRGPEGGLHQLRAVHRLVLRRLQQLRHRTEEGRSQRQLRRRRGPARWELLLRCPTHAAGRVPAGRHLHGGHGQRHPGPGHPAVRAEDQAAVAQRLRPDPPQPVLAASCRGST